MFYFYFGNTLKETQISHASDRNEEFDPADKMKRQSVEVSSLEDLMLLVGWGGDSFRRAKVSTK